MRCFQVAYLLADCNDGKNNNTPEWDITPPSSSSLSYDGNFYEHPNFKTASASIEELYLEQRVCSIKSAPFREDGQGTTKKVVGVSYSGPEMKEALSKKGRLKLHRSVQFAKSVSSSLGLLQSSRVREIPS